MPPQRATASHDGDDDNGASTLDRMSQPLLVDAPDENDISPSPIAVPQHAASSVHIRRSFLRMSALFAANHGCTVSVLGLASSRLGPVGVWQSGVLFGSYTLSALFGASYFVKKLGSRNGLVMGMGMSASYVASFFLASVAAETSDGLAWLPGAVAIAGALVGGVGSSVLWVSQGTYFSTASRLVASKEGEAVEDITGKFSGHFAFIFLLLEVILKVLSTLLIETVGVSWKVIFGLYSLLSILPVLLMMGVADLETFKESTLALTSEDDRNEEEDVSPSHKATAALDLLSKDPKTKYLSPLSILFGLSTSFGVSVLNGEVTRQVLSDPDAKYVGLYTAVTSTVAALASLLFGRLESSHRGMHCGKELVLTLGASSYLLVGLQFLIVPSHYWNEISLLWVYTLLGLGRATYEGTLRAIFADFFPTNKEGAFANIILFSGTASTIGYVLSVTGALQCNEASRYCLEYGDGSTHNVLVMELLVIIMGIVAIPALWRAVWMFRREQDSLVSNAQR